MSAAEFINEYISPWLVVLTPVTALITVIIILKQSKILKTEIATQKTQIEQLKSYNEMFDLERVKQANSFIMEGYTLKNEQEKDAIKKEKEEMQQKYEESLETQTKQLSVTQEEFQRILGDLNSTDERLVATTEELERLRKDFEKEKFHSDFQSMAYMELIDVVVQLIASNLPNEKWDEFVDQNIPNSSMLVKYGLQMKGEKIVEDAMQRSIELQELFNMTLYTPRRARARMRVRTNVAAKKERDITDPNTLLGTKDAD